MPRIKRQIDVVDVEDAEDYLSARRALEKTAGADDVSEVPSEPTPKAVVVEAQPEAQPKVQAPVVEEKEDDHEVIIGNSVADEVVEVKPTPKRVPRKKVEKVAPPPEPPAPPPAPSRSDAKVSCPDCGRSVSKKTLRYTHKYQCTGRQSVSMREPSPEATPAPAKPVMMKSPFLRKPPESRYGHLEFF